MEFHRNLSDKKLLFSNLRAYYELIGENPFEYMPLTYHLTKGLQDPIFETFLAEFNARNRKSNIWILKPGENSNRGQSIQVLNNLDKIKEAIGSEETLKTWILQEYIVNPLLVYKRKFDIRCYVLVTAFNGVVQAYFYTEGYLRTACKEYNIKNVTNKFIHLTNDAIQKHSSDYGKYENGNKMSYMDFQKYINRNFAPRVNFCAEVMPKIRKIVADSIAATYQKLNASQRSHSFELLGYDFMVDTNWKPWIIEVNTNPCLALSSPYLSRLIPEVLENAARMTIDVLFPRPPNATKRAVSSVFDNILPQNRFELVFNSLTDGAKLTNQLGDRIQTLQPQEETQDETAPESETTEEIEAA